MGAERIDTRLLEELTEQSQDLNSDAVRITAEALEDFTEVTRDEAASASPSASDARSRRWWRRGSTVAGVAGAAALLTQMRAVAATTSDDIMALQTAASIENLAISVYRTAAGLPFIKDGNKTVAAFIAKTTTQHQAHAQAFNAAATQAGGKAQSGPDPKYAAVVKKALPSIKTPADVVALAITLEDVAAQTYAKNVGQVSSNELRKLFASVAPVEAQHRATLLAVQALLAGNLGDLIAIPTNAAKLPAAAGSVGFPDAFYPTKSASPITEGAVK
ncbi:Ferritin-like domain-containing protein [Streptomyces sp. DvalAA-14]|uniref:ferritin-like domain-containing protein n=1 Tax=unclassified Streptomyces TaxID=2593676 RepID=UPI00081AEB8A|nr:MULTISPECIES: ferritin-like domain-containing protein [unclassified Streptomyces]MYS22847.1 ferritin-like domain-containing protein [Streptomyces sp. SID4948]SCE23183.1 Ferritin-like domain-containing protein [Streptomyces sp. DvalAA-14]